MKPIERTPVNGRYKTSRPSIREKQLIEKFDPLSDSVVESYAGLITRMAVDIARYSRSIANECNQEATDHYQRLIQAAEYLAQARMLDLAVSNPKSASDVKELVESIQWPTVQPELTFPVAYDGTEPPITVTFVPFVPMTQKQTVRHGLPA